jgi:hypothetical protein
METNLATIKDKVTIAFDRLDKIQENQLQIERLKGEKLDKVVDIAGKLMKVGDLINESKRLDNEQIVLKKELATILSKHQKDMFFISKIFEERGKSLSKFFEVIDRGLETGNDDLVLRGLAATNDLVLNDPLKRIDDFRNKLDNDNFLELDF